MVVQVYSLQASQNFVYLFLIWLSASLVLFSQHEEIDIAKST